MKTVPDDYYYNPALHTGVTRQYLEFTKYSRDLVENDQFNYFIVFIIILAGINVGVQSYPSMSGLEVLKICDIVILCVFSLEVIVKVLSEGLAPQQYFIGKEWKWNNFDFGIVFMSLPFWGGLFGGGSLALLRLVRLMRLAKLIKKVPQLQMIVQGLTGGLSSIGYILLLLLLVFYLFAVVGFYLFRENDPFHFSTLPISMLTMFRCSTLDAWSDVMYVSIFGCDDYPYIYVSQADQTPDNRIFWCRDPNSQYAISAAYFIVFIVVSALVMLSLFIGAVTMSMNESMNELKKMSEEKKKKEKFEKNRAKMFLTSSRMMQPRLQSPLGPRSTSTKSVGSQHTTDAVKQAKLLGAIARQRMQEEEDELSFASRSLKLVMPTFISSYFDKAIDESESQKARIGVCLRVAMGEESPDVLAVKRNLRLWLSPDLTYQEKYMVFANACKYIAEHPRFVGFVTFVIVLAGFNVGAQTDPRIMAINELVQVLRVMDVFILSVFTLECGLKILAENFKPWVYFYDNWNKFDFLIVVGSYVPGAGSLLTILRLLRLLRVLKLVKSLPQLALIVNALLMGMGSIGYIGLILFLCFYIFAILGMLLFRENDPQHFGSLHISMFSLFRCSTLDDWTEILYVNIYGCDIYPGVYEDFPEKCTNPTPRGFLAVLYFVCFIIIGAQVLLTLFIGVVTTSMEQAKEIQQREQKLDLQLVKIKAKYDLLDVQVDYFREVFNMLDLDGGGTIEDEELEVGLQAVKDLLDGTDIETTLRNADPDNKGIDVIQFIECMCNTPMVRHKRVLRRCLRFYTAKKRRRKSLLERVNAAGNAISNAAAIGAAFIEEARETITSRLPLGSPRFFKKSHDTYDLPPTRRRRFSSTVLPESALEREIVRLASNHAIEERTPAAAPLPDGLSIRSIHTQSIEKLLSRSSSHLAGAIEVSARTARYLKERADSDGGSRPATGEVSLRKKPTPRK